MSRLIRIFTVCLVILFIPMNELRNKQSGCLNLAVCPNIPVFTLPYLFQNMPNESERVPPFSAEKQTALNKNNSPVVSAVGLPNGVDDELATKDREVAKKKGTCKPGKLAKMKRIYVTITIIR